MNQGTEPEHVTPTDLSQMPANFHPGKTWVRMGLWVASLVAIKLVALSIYALETLFGGTGIALGLFTLLVIFPLIAAFIGASSETAIKFSLPRTAQSWASRAEIGHHLKHRPKVVEWARLRGFSWHDLALFALIILYGSGWPGRSPILFLATPLIAIIWAYVTADQNRHCADKMAKSDPRIAALVDAKK